MTPGCGVRGAGCGMPGAGGRLPAGAYGGPSLRVGLAAVLLAATATIASAQPATPQLTGPVNDFANIIDAAGEAELQRRITALLNASGDVVVVATVPNIEGFADIKVGDVLELFRTKQVEQTLND